MDIDFLFLINFIVDMVFFFDIYVNFRLPYRDEQTGQVVRDGGAIAQRYLRGWFPLDILSVLPFEYLGFISGGESSQTNLAQLRLLRFLRLARLLKLLRVLRASRKLRKWQVYINLRYATLQFVQVCSKKIQLMNAMSQTLFLPNSTLL
jgi:hypothetical protein